MSPHIGGDQDIPKQDALANPVDPAVDPDDADALDLADEQSASAPINFPVVGVGASAGGLESLERMFRAMPVNTGMAFVVIQHLSPDFKSLMDELLARYTDMPIHRAEHGMVVEPNSVYLIPPKKDMIISDRRLLLTDKDLTQPLSMPIDRFFRSLAQDAGRFAIGVILSGSGSDGSRGVRDIHAAGGLVVCESEQTAKFDGMPLATIGTGEVDAVAAPEQVASVLERHVRQMSMAAQSLTDGIPPEPDGIQRVFKSLNDTYGIDFSHYKPNTVIRRVQRRLSMAQTGSLTEYAERIESDPTELNALYRDLLIGVTRFFRDPEAFEKLARDVIPSLVEKCGRDEEVRVWVAGCATGEEAYSIAILLHDQLQKAGRSGCAKVFATDVHRASLEIASEALYPEESLTDVPRELFERYFDRRSDGYRVANEIRQMLVFATHNIIRDAPFTKLDLVTCRNLLIYFRPMAQKKAISLFHFGLKPGAFLFLGPSETPGDLQSEFDMVDTHWKIYRKARDVRLPVEVRAPLAPMPRPLQQLPAPPVRSFPDPGLVGAYDALLERYMPPAILINERRELLHVFGDIDRFLRVKRGRPSLDVLEALDPDLRTAITGALQRVIKEGQPVRYSGVRARTERGEEVLDLAVEPVDNQRSRSAQILILIREAVRPSVAPPPVTDGDESSANQQISRDRIEALETELRFTKENLQATIEELETSNEEMQATNEELVASNEELQSTNEELQSVNEELFTVNAEYQRKIYELSEMTADMDNLLESTDIGTIFLDENLQIRKFTPQIGQAFHLLPQDVGRPIESFSHSIQHTGLIEDLQRVRSTREPCYREVRDQNGKDLYLRILPYRTKTKYDGIVVTLVDVSLLKAAERRLADAVRLRDEFLAMLSHELRNPLGAIQSAAQLIALKPNLDEDLRDARDVVQRQAAHLARLLDDLLDVSRVTQRKIELRRGPAAIDTIIRDAIETVMPLFDAGELKFAADRAQAKDVIVEADSVRLQQAISNVLANAAKYTPRGGSVSLKVESNRAEVVLTVRDTGVGIEPDKLESIFDLFVQSDQSLHRSKGGMGIGLTLARSIIELHHGTIIARSDGNDKGSEFVIRLPRLAQRAAPAPDKDARQSKSRECFQCKVVIVEDGDDSRLMLKMLLETQGCTVLTAENGLKGLALIEQSQPDVAIVDIGLPGLSGYDVARQVRAGTSGTAPYLVALTGYGRASDVQKALDAGFDSHLVKPLDLSKLTRILEFQSRKDAAT